MSYELLTGGKLFLRLDGRVSTNHSHIMTDWSLWLSIVVVTAGNYTSNAISQRLFVRIKFGSSRIRKRAVTHFKHRDRAF